MSQKFGRNLEVERQLMVELWDPAVADDPEEFVRFVFPWGKTNTPLANFAGPRTWQIEVLREIKNAIAKNTAASVPEVLQKAVASGRGPGKSALVAWLIHWMQSTRLGSTVIVTANNETQLKSRTWAELGKWHTLAINSHWFDRTALSYRPADWFEQALKTQMRIDTGYYYAQAQLWSEENPDAFAGVHNPLGVMIIYDEASGIPASIWKVTEGFFTEPVVHRYWFAFSNPRRNTGAFYECFHSHRNFWSTLNLDSRSVEGTDQKVLQGIVDRYGADSDEARVEVYGQFPHQSDKQFISRDVIRGAADRELTPDPSAPLIMGVDVARSGRAKSVIRFRQGRDARSIPPIKFKGLDNMQLAYRVAEAIRKYDPAAVCIDAGNGTGVIDRLRELKYRVHEIWFGSAADSPEWYNKRTEMYARVREWLNGGCIPEEQELMADLAGPEYHYAGKGGGQICLESKEHMEERGLPSPDDGDALALTFAVKVARYDLKAGGRAHSQPRIANDVDYEVFG